MNRLEAWKNRVLLPILGVVLAFLASTAQLSATPAYAVPTDPVATPAETTTENNDTTNTPDTSTTDATDAPNTSDTSETETTAGTTTESASEDGEEETHTCYSEVGALGWLLCPATGLLSKGIDFLYGLIEELLAINPVDLSSESPVYIVWTYMRNITNIVFIIFLLIIVYSQITGFGINNYGIKRALPRLIIAAILVNISYIICAFAVDASNAIGSSLSELFTTIGTNAFAGQSFDAISSIGIYELFIGVASGTAITALGIAFAGGILELLLLLIPVILAGLIAVLTGLFMLSLRQALIMILLVISPLAFICYLLPNTEKWYRKWLSMFVQMLTFYPMFAVLFGASRLAGWLFIASATGPLGVILGVAVQILPLFLAFQLMKLSGTVLGGVSAALGRLGQRATGGARNYLDPIRQSNRAEKIAKYSQRGFNPFIGGAWLARRNARQFRHSDRQKLAGATADIINKEKLDALKQGRRIIGYDRKTGDALYARRAIGTSKDGKTLYSTRPIVRGGQIADRGMRQAIDREGIYRSAKLRADGQAMRTEAMQGSLHDYLKNQGVKKGLGYNYSSRTAAYFEELGWATQEKTINDLADQDFLVKRLTAPQLRDDKTGKLIDEAAYKKLILGNAGYTQFAHNQQTIEGQYLAKNMEQQFLGNIGAMYKDYHTAASRRIENYVENQVTKELIRVYNGARDRQDLDAIIACNNALFFRGDHDVITDAMKQYYNDGNVNLATVDSNRLALNLLAMKNAAPNLGRFGKFLNMETWRYTSGDRGNVQLVTFDQYETGYVRIPEVDANGEVIYDLVPSKTEPGMMVKKVRYTDEFLHEIDSKTGQPLDKPYRTKINLPIGLTGTPLNGIDRTFGESVYRHFANITPDMFPDSTQFQNDTLAERARQNGVSEKEQAARDQLDEIYRALMPQIVTATPTFASGSEQIYSMARLLTGLKKDNYGGWKDGLEDYKNTDKYGDGTFERISGAVKKARKLYLDSLTPSDLLKMKSDIWGAYTERLSREAIEQDEIELNRDFTDFEGDFEGRKWTAGTYKLSDIADTKERKQLAKVYAYQQMRDTMKYQIQKLAEGSQNLELMKVPIRKALMIDEDRDQVRQARIERARKGRGGGNNGGGNNGGPSNPSGPSGNGPRNNGPRGGGGPHGGTPDSDVTGEGPDAAGGPYEAFDVTDASRDDARAWLETHGGDISRLAQDYRQSHPSANFTGEDIDYLQQVYEDAVIHGETTQPFELWIQDQFNN